MDYILVISYFSPKFQIVSVFYCIALRHQHHPNNHYELSIILGAEAPSQTCTIARGAHHEQLASHCSQAYESSEPLCPLDIHCGHVACFGQRFMNECFCPLFSVSQIK